MASIGELGRKFETLVRERKQVDKTSEDLKKQIDSLEQELIEAMADEGLQGLPLESGMTLYRRTDKFYGVAEGFAKKDLCEALANHPDTMDLVEVNFNSNSLRARLKEMESLGREIPAEIMEKLKVIEKYRIGHRS